MSEKLKCLGENCSTLIQPTIAKSTHGLCKPCARKAKENPSSRFVDLLSVLFGLPFALFALAIILSGWFYFFSDLFRFVRLPGELARDGIETEAVFWEVEVEQHTHGKGTSTWHTYTQEHKARFFDQDKELYQVSLEDAVGSYPFMEVLAVRQRFLIRYLPDDPFSFTFAFKHDESTMIAAVEAAERQPLLNGAIIRVDPIVLSEDNERGFAVVHVSNNMLNQSWLLDPLTLARAKEYGLREQERSDAYIGLTTGESTGGITGKSNLHPKNSEEQDAFGVLNLVKPNDKIKIKLQSRSKGQDDRSYTVTAVFFLQLSDHEQKTLSVGDVKSVEVELCR